MYDYCEFCEKRIGKWKVCISIRQNGTNIPIVFNFPAPFKSEHKSINRAGKLLLLSTVFTVVSCNRCLTKLPKLDSPWAILKTRNYSDLKECTVCDRDRVANSHLLTIINGEEIESDCFRIDTIIGYFLDINPLTHIKKWNTNVCKRCVNTRIPKLIKKFTFNKDKLKKLMDTTRLILNRTKLVSDLIRLIQEYLIQPTVINKYTFKLTDIKYDR